MDFLHQMQLLRDALPGKQARSLLACQPSWSQGHALIALVGQHKTSPTRLPEGMVEHRALR